MTDEQKREDFEAAYVAELVRRCGEGFRETAMYSLTAKKPNGDYQHYTDGIAWWGWQASRAALSIAASDFDAAQSELAALREELASVSSMACMLEDREWAEHVSKGPIAEKMESAITELHNELSESRQLLADAERRYHGLRKVTPYKFKKMQDAATTDGVDVLYFHADRFDALLDAALTKPEEAKS